MPPAYRHGFATQPLRAGAVFMPMYCYNSWTVLGSVSVLLGLIFGTVCFLSAFPSSPAQACVVLTAICGMSTMASRKLSTFLDLTSNSWTHHLFELRVLWSDSSLRLNCSLHLFWFKAVVFENHLRSHRHPTPLLVVNMLCLLPSRGALYPRRFSVPTPWQPISGYLVTPAQAQTKCMLVFCSFCSSKWTSLEISFLLEIGVLNV